MIRDEHLDDCCRRFAESRQRFEALAANVSDQQAIWKPAPGRWSVAECLEHLNVSMDLYEPGMRKALDAARASGVTGSGPWRRRTLTGRLLLWALDPSARRSLPAPRMFQPESSADVDPSRIYEGFRSRLERFVQLAQDADGLALDRIRTPTPIGSLFRVTLAEAFEVHARHIPRHLGQAEAVTRGPGFPD